MRGKRWRLVLPERDNLKSKIAAEREKTETNEAAQPRARRDVHTAFCGNQRAAGRGRGDRIRTCDLLVPNQALYQAKLHPERRTREVWPSRGSVNDRLLPEPVREDR